MAADYYKTLGVSREADADEIRKAYRKLARKHHPDLNPGDKAAEDRFKNVQEAYDILSEPKKKTMYDQYGFYSENGMPQSGGRRRGRPAQSEHGLRRIRFFGGVPGRRRGVARPRKALRIFRTFSASGSEEARRPMRARLLRKRERISNTG